jgi:membrane-bound lytic murein transglycosylase F
MHDEHDSSHGSEGPQPEPLPDALPELPLEPSPDSQPNLLPNALRNWQVLEIDGQATPVPEPASSGAPPGSKSSGGRPEDMRDLQIEDRQDEIVVVTLDNRRRQVECGGTATYSVSVLNNGDHAALFQVQLEGWLDPHWLGDTTAAAMLEPGARALLRLPLSPPRRAESEAGDYHFAVNVRSPQYPGRVARLGALLTVLPYDAVEVRFLESPEVALSWFKRAAILPLALANRGNCSVEVELRGASSPHTCRFAFALPSNDAGAAAVSLHPNQGISVPVRVEMQRPPLFGIQGDEVGVQVDARIGGQVMARTRTELFAQPLVGPWQLVMASGLAAAAMVGLLLFLTLVYLLAQRSLLPETAAVQQPAAAAAVSAPPVIIVNLNQPAGEPPQGSAGTVGSDFTAGAAPDPGLPLVLPDQVSAPGAAPVAASARTGPGQTAGAPSSALSFATASAPATTGAGDANQTYGQMFQDVGRRFDLDWRMLAAQAYIESGFDSLALSDSGAMGLMQVLPATWREWATPVEVSDPFDAYSNVLVAAVYLDHLRSQLAATGYPDKQWMLVAYNWGPDRLNDFLQSGGTWDTLPEARRQYASEILRIATTIP